jgi:catechol 2,3-dioxygenase-like lactoylglutathione lyase family enzyme
MADGNGSIIRPRLHHWGMRTLKLDEMVDWYSKVCGYEIVLEARQTDVSAESPPQSAYVSNDEEHHRGGFFTLPMFKDHPERNFMPGVNHLAFDYDSVDDLLSSWERLKAEGIEPALCTDHGPTFAFYYKDPENNTVELCCDAWEDESKPREIMSSPRMLQNPMGSQVDPAKLLEARRGGLSLAELHERAMADEYAPSQPGNPMVLI